MVCLQKSVLGCALVFLVFLDILAGCVSVPVAETNAFVSAVDAVKSASDVLLGQLNAAEKDLHLRKAKAAGNTYVFSVGDADYYSTLDTFGPSTEKFKAAIEIIKDYSTLIQALAQGQGNDAIRDQIKKIASNVSILIHVPGFDAAVAALSPLIDKALLAESQDEARTLVRRGAPAVHNLIEALKNATPAMFKLLMAESFATQSDVQADSERTRIALSNYVVLLDRLSDTFDRLVDAFSRPDNRQRSLPSLQQPASSTPMPRSSARPFQLHTSNSGGV